MSNKHGSKWIRPARRERIYRRDSHQCVFCLSRQCGENPLTLDHLRPRIKLGTNASGNLVTCCFRCNSSRGARTVRSFCIDVAQYLGHDWRVTLARVKNAARRKL